MSLIPILADLRYPSDVGGPHSTPPREQKIIQHHSANVKEAPRPPTAHSHVLGDG